MSGRISLLALPVLSLMAQPASARDRSLTSVEPSSNWSLDYGETRCRIARTFGADADQTALYFEQYQPSEIFTWVIGGPLIERMNVSTKFSVQFGPQFSPFGVEPEVTMKLGSFGEAIRGYGVEEKSEEEETDSDGEPIGLPLLPTDAGRLIDWIEISRGSQALRLETGNLGPVFEAMNKCMEDLVRHWGAEPEILRSRMTQPKLINPSQVAHMVQRHYPTVAERKKYQAELQARVMVEADGTVSKCFINAVTTAEQFDNEACVVFMQAAKFKPALNMEGRPVPSYYTTKILYRIF